LKAAADSDVPETDLDSEEARLTVLDPPMEEATNSLMWEGIFERQMVLWVDSTKDRLAVMTNNPPRAQMLMTECCKIKKFFQDHQKHSIQKKQSYRDQLGNRGNIGLRVLSSIMLALICGKQREIISSLMQRK